MFAKELKKELAENKFLSNNNEQLLCNFLRNRFVDHKDKSIFISFSYMDSIRTKNSLMCFPIALVNDVKSWLEVNGFKVVMESGNANSASMNVYLD